MTTIGISASSYQLPSSIQSVTQLESAGLLNSGAALMQSFGFSQCHTVAACETIIDLAITSATTILDEPGVNREQLGKFMFYSGVRPDSALSAPLDLFVYPLSKLQHELGLDNVNAIALSQQGCCGLLSMIDLAAELLSQATFESILCVTADGLPAGMPREIMYNVISDAAASVLVKRDSQRNRVIHFYQHTQPHYWDTPKHEQELSAAYFPLAQRVIAKTLCQAGLNLSDLRWIVPNNVSVRSWEILASMLSFPVERVWTNNIGRIGHTVSCDHIINLCDMQAQGQLAPGDLLALFTFGFGASWSCMILEH